MTTKSTLSFLDIKTFKQLIGFLFTDGKIGLWVFTVILIIGIMAIMNLSFINGKVVVNPNIKMEDIKDLKGTGK
jgi:hypothetical protein